MNWLAVGSDDRPWAYWEGDCRAVVFCCCQDLLGSGHVGKWLKAKQDSWHIIKFSFTKMIIHFLIYCMLGIVIRFYWGHNVHSLVNYNKRQWLMKCQSLTYRTCRVPTSLVTSNFMYFPGYFHVKTMKSLVNLALNHSVGVDNLDITYM